MHPISPRQSLPSSRRRLLSQGGFTIMEVALASFVMALGLSTTILTMQAGYRFLDVARDTTLASQIIQSEIERIRLMNWGAVCALKESEEIGLGSIFSSESTPSSSGSSGSTTPSAPAPPEFTSRFKVLRTVTPDPDPTRKDFIRTITVVVTWTGFDGRSHSRQFQAKYVQNGLYDYLYTSAAPVL